MAAASLARHERIDRPIRMSTNNEGSKGLCSLRRFQRIINESFGPIKVEPQLHPVPGHAGEGVLQFRISRGGGKRGTSPGLLPAAFSGGLRCTGLDRHPDRKHGHGIFSWPLIEANA
jgi:hypothetical protein